MKYTLYATNQDGEGFVQKIGEYETIEEIEIRVGMFAPDVVISIGEDYSDEVEELIVPFNKI